MCVIMKLYFFVKTSESAQAAPHETYGILNEFWSPIGNGICGMEVCGLIMARKLCCGCN